VVTDPEPQDLVTRSHGAQGAVNESYTRSDKPPRTLCSLEMKPRMPGIRLKLPECGARLLPNLWRQRSQTFSEVGINA
jgi:hypothetical protein